MKKIFNLVVFGLLVGLPIAVNSMEEAEQNRMPFFSAINFHQIDQIRSLLVSDPSLANAMYSPSFSAVMLAAEKGQNDTVEALINAGADVNFANDEGETALMRAVRYGETQIIQKLLAAHADPFARNAMNQTALDIARDHGHVAVARILESHMQKGKIK